jgi:hypothetical protein
MLKVKKYLSLQTLFFGLIVSVPLTLANVNSVFLYRAY